MATAYKNPPAFDTDSKSCNHWIEEVKAWVEIPELAKAKQSKFVRLGE